MSSPRPQGPRATLGFDPPARSFASTSACDSHETKQRLMEASPAAVGVYTPVACEQL